LNQQPLTTNVIAQQFAEKVFCCVQLDRSGLKPPLKTRRLSQREPLRHPKLNALPTFSAAFKR